MRHVRYFIIGVCGLIAWSGADAQKAVARVDAHPKAQKAYEAGVQAAFSSDKKFAIKMFEAAIKREPNFADALVELAGIYYNAGNYVIAEQYLERVAKFEGDAGRKALYGLAMAELKQDKPAEAKEHLNGYLKSTTLRPDRRKAAERYLAEATFKEQAFANPYELSLKRLPPEINIATEAEYLPSLTADGNTLVFTRRVNNRQEDFFISHKNDRGEWELAAPLAGVNTLENEGAQTISADGKLIVFTGCDRKGGLGSCDLYYSQLKDGEWTAPANLGAPVNSKAWESQPSLAANGNLLFFTSIRKDGFGGADLYASGRTPSGGWTTPINLGPKVNTEKDDQAPFFHPDGKTLYFMSMGHPGMGNFDLYLTRLGEDNTWETPTNLGYPINTESNEGAIAVAIDGKTAYYATDAAGQGDSISVGGSSSGTTDLFSFTLPQNARAGVVTYVKATVINAITKMPLAAAALFTDEQAKKPFLKRRASEQDGTFLAVLPSGKTYTLSVEEPGYLFYSDRFELKEPANATEPFELLIELQPIAPEAPSAEIKVERTPIVLKNVRFATGSAELLASSEAELQKLNSLLTENEHLRIRLQGHTDDVGEEADNLALSQQRAEAVKSYLIERGINVARLDAVGFGESRPLVANDSNANRAINRRTEFILIED